MVNRIGEIASPQFRAGRPSLYLDQSSEKNDASQASSILGQLDPPHGGSKRKKHFAYIFLICALAVGWYTLQEKLAAMPNWFYQIQSDLSLANAPTAKPSAVPAFAPQSQQIAMQSVIPTEAPQPAKIINEAVATESPRINGQDAQDLELNKVHSQDSTALLSRDNVQAFSVDSNQGAEATIPNVANRQQAKPQISPAKPALVDPKPPLVLASIDPIQNAKPAKPSAKSASGEKTKKDGDVELIAALLNRVSVKTEATTATRDRKTESSKSPSRPPLSKKKDKKNAVSQESAPVAATDSTASKLKRCDGMNFFEAELCRFKTCNGRWGVDSACPDNEQISSFKP